MSFRSIEVFKEKWKVFLKETIDPTILKNGLLSMSEENLLAFDSSFNLDPSLNLENYQWTGTRRGYRVGFSKKDIIVLELWKHIFNKI